MHPQLFVFPDFNFYSHTSREVWRKSGGIRKMRENISTHTPLARCDVATMLLSVCSYNFYSHTSREVWLPSLSLLCALKFISTHTPLARCDESGNSSIKFFQNFYSHTSREVWPIDYSNLSPELQFLLTHLSRGVTSLGGWLIQGENCISTHTPLARCDRQTLRILQIHGGFLLTHLSRGVTAISCVFLQSYL